MLGKTQKIKKLTKLISKNKPKQKKVKESLSQSSQPTKIIQPKIIIQYDDDESEDQQQQSESDNQQNTNNNQLENNSQNDSENQIEEEQQNIKEINKHIKLSNKPVREQPPTMSICLPDSIIELAQSEELRAYFVSQIARLASIFCIDEIILMKDFSYKPKNDKLDASAYISRNLQYLETPQYLRKRLFEIHHDLKYVGLMTPIECHHHLLIDDISEYREGVVVDRPIKDKNGSWVEVGLRKQAILDQKIVPGTRVTIKLEDYQDVNNPTVKHLRGTAVSPLEPKIKLKKYWGYSVRLAVGINKVFNECPYEGGYDLKIAVEDDGEEAIEVDWSHHNNAKHILCVFGGSSGLKSLIEADEKTKYNLSNYKTAFDYVIKDDINIGVRKLRTEEEAFLILHTLKKYLYL